MLNLHPALNRSRMNIAVACSSSRSQLQVRPALAKVDDVLSMQSSKAIKKTRTTKP